MTFLFIIVMINSGCSVDSLDSDSSSDASITKTGILFGKESIIMAGATAKDSSRSRTALPPSSTRLTDNFSDIALYKRAVSVTGDYGDAVVTYKTYNDIERDPKLFEVSTGEYNFKLVMKVGGCDYTQELTNVTVSSTPKVIKFDKLTAKESSDKGSAKIGIIAYDSAMTGVAQIYAKMDTGAEEKVTLKKTNDSNDYQTGFYTKKDVAQGSHKITLLFKNAAGSTLYNYIVYAQVYAGLESREDVTLNITNDNTFLICTVTYKDEENQSTTPKTQNFNIGEKIYTLDEAGFSSPAGKKFIAWCDEKTGSAGNIYKAGDVPLFSGNTTLYARYLDYSASTFKITNKDELVLFMASGTKEVGTLQNDIDLGEWVPVSNFGGTLDGNSKSLKMNVNQENAAFINELSGEVKNLVIKDSTFTARGSGDTFSAAVAIDVVDSGKITNCTASGCTISAVSTGYSTTTCAAGIVATVEENATVTSCSTLGGNIDGKYAAGIASDNHGTVDTTSGNVTATITHSICGGGIVAYNYNTGKITGNGTTGATFTYKYPRRWGYVVGDFKTIKDVYGNDITNISKNIIVSNPNTLASQKEYSVEPYSGSKPSGQGITAMEIELKQTGRIQLTVKISNGAIYGAVTEQEKNYDAKDGPYLVTTGHLTSGSKTITTNYLKAGTYYIRLYNDSHIGGTHTGTYSVIVE